MSNSTNMTAITMGTSNPVMAKAYYLYAMVTMSDLTLTNNIRMEASVCYFPHP